MRFRPDALGRAVLLLSFLTLLPDSLLAGKPLSVRRLRIPDDVPVHLCSAQTQDRDGFLWMGTQAGLVRFDGYDFRVFRSDPDDLATLGGAYVRTLLTSRDGRIWAGTFGGGLSVYDPETETFTRFRHDPKDAASLSHDRVEGLAEDPSGSIWVATRIWPSRTSSCQRT